MTRARKKATNVSIRSDLLDAARSAGISLSALFERALRDELRRAAQAEWRANNREAVATYNAHVGKHGVFSDGRRTF
jgi:antitoxin CcdA